MMVVHWARKHDRPILGALLAAPADVESQFPEGYPTTEMLRHHGWQPVPRARLPFPSILAASENDSLCSLGRATEMARHWGSTLANIGMVGHLNPAAGFGEWPQAEQFIRMLATAPVTVRDCRVA